MACSTLRTIVFCSSHCLSSGGNWFSLTNQSLEAHIGHWKHNKPHAGTKMTSKRTPRRLSNQQERPRQLQEALQRASWPPPSRKTKRPSGVARESRGSRAAILHGRGDDFQNIVFCGTEIRYATPVQTKVSKRCGRGANFRRETQNGDSALFNIK